jgi:ATP-binding cassette subfamily B protein
MAQAAYKVSEGGMSVGDLVLVNSYLLQLFQPLNWIGSIYRMVQQSFTEMEQVCGCWSSRCLCMRMLTYAEVC